MLYESRKSIDTYLKITVPLLALIVPQRTFNIHESGYLKVKSGKSWERAWCLKMLSKIDSSLGFGTELIYYSNNTQRFSLRSLTSTWPEEQHSNNRRKTIFFFTHHLMKTKKALWDTTIWILFEKGSDAAIKHLLKTVFKHNVVFHSIQSIILKKQILLSI